MMVIGTAQHLTMRTTHVHVGVAADKQLASFF
jgi:hypothetical protein